ncbi:hypothetical protein [Phytohabitans rumicis]|uniref:hypothetical protein n=1 Tax=Phytohabitans rumicis TaxID=1076125 RepID=UPI003CD05AF6
MILVLFTTCRGEGGSGAAKTNATPTPDVTASVLTPEVDQSTAAESPAPTEPPPTSAPATSAPPQQADGACTNAEIKVTVVPGLTNAPAGQTIVLKIRFKNESDRTCQRDVGPDFQEIYIKQGAQVIWSSDKCGTAKGSDPQSFTPNFEREYRATWNGNQSTNCSNGSASGRPPAPGEYEVHGRLGTDQSSAVKLTLT